MHPNIISQKDKLFVHSFNINAPKNPQFILIQTKTVDQFSQAKQFYCSEQYILFRSHKLCRVQLDSLFRRYTLQATLKNLVLDSKKILSSINQTSFTSQMSVLKAIKQRLNETPDFVNAEELDLSQIKIGRFTQEVKKYLEKCKKVNFLSLRQCELESLENLPAWKLTAIDLSDNNLRDDTIPILVSYPTLSQIGASNNQFQNLQSLKALTALKELVEVDFSENPVSAISNYRQTLFNTISTLEAVDHKDKDGNDLEDEEEEQFQDGSDEEQEFDEDQLSEDYEQEEEESESEKPKKKKK